MDFNNSLSPVLRSLAPTLAALCILVGLEEVPDVLGEQGLEEVPDVLGEQGLGEQGLEEDSEAFDAHEDEQGLEEVPGALEEIDLEEQGLEEDAAAAAAVAALSANQVHQQPPANPAAAAPQANQSQQEPPANAAVGPVLNLMVVYGQQAIPLVTPDVNGVIPQETDDASLAKVGRGNPDPPVNYAQLVDVSMTVSETHAGFYRDGNAFFIRDMFSTNGTKVNRVALAPGRDHDRPLRHGDTVAMGDRLMVIAII